MADISVLRDEITAKIGARDRDELLAALLAAGVLEPRQRHTERTHQDRELIRGKAPPRGERSRGITSRPPDRALRGIAGALGSGLEDLPVGIGPERRQRLTTRGFGVRLRREPGLLLPLANQGSRGIAQAKQSLVEAIDQ